MDPILLGMLCFVAGFWSAMKVASWIYSASPVFVPDEETLRIRRLMLDDEC